MKTVEHMLKEKGNQTWSISPEASVYDAIKLMSDKHVGALPVMEGKKLVGMVSERDYARKVVLQNKRSSETKVKEIMSSKVLCVTLERSAEECMALMTDKHVRHLPVVVNSEVKGILSIGDIVKSVIAEKQFIIKQLENYITGR